VADPAYSLAAAIPAAAEYRELRLAAGLSPKTDAATRAGLPKSLFAVCVRCDDQLVGMGRVIGDGGLNFEIVDIAVHPDHQRQGLGKKIMAALMDYIHTNAPPSAYVCLIADDWAPALYRKFGFEFTAPKSVGMALRID
jgi:ribosomal protein S18 acetylase RimI-like enzyme